MEHYHDDDDDAGGPLIHRAAGRGDVETATQELDADPAAVHCRNAIDNQPLHEACWAKHTPMVRLLLDRGADVNARGDFGQTPLHFAVRDGGQEAAAIVAMLLDAGADASLKDERLEEDALGFAAREYKDELEPAMQLLRERAEAGPSV